MLRFVRSHRFGVSLLFALVAGVVLIRLSGGCPIYRIFHIECLTCGMTHALLSAVKLDFKTAFHFHPMFWSVPIIALYILFEGRLFKKRALNVIILSLIAIGFAVQYVLKYKGIV